MDEQVQEDWLDARLREEAPYIDDDGFTARLMQQLPAAQPRRRSVRAAILIGITAIGCIVAFLLSANFLVTSAAFLVAMPLLTVFIIALVCGLATTVFGTTVALARIRGHRL